MSKLILACALLCACAAATGAQVAGVERLRDVTSVYVPEWGDSVKAKVLRETVVRALAESGRVRVVEKRAQADAVLDLNVREVSKNVDAPQSVFNDPAIKVGSTVKTVDVLVFSLSTGEGRALWTEKLDPDNFRGGDEARVARALGARAGRDLLKAVERDTRKPGRRRGEHTTLPAELAFKK